MLKAFINYTADYIKGGVMNRFAIVALFVLTFSAMTYAGVGETLNNLCFQARGLIPIVAFVLIVFAGLVYAAGQVLGAEMRSRTNVWATTMVIGAIIGLIFTFSAPAIISLVAGAFGMDLETYEYTCETLL
ncbi:MAG: hypothetical protein QXU54_01795 [Candidatus Micrarchaeia archaeon]